MSQGNRRAGFGILHFGTRTQRLGPVARGCAMTQRRRVKQTAPLEDRLAQEAQKLRAQARKLPPGAERETLLRKARQYDTGSHMSEWLHSPGHQPPS